MGSVVRNMLDSPIFLKKGVWVACMVSALLVLPVELSPDREVALGAEAAQEPMTVATWQDKLLGNLNLDGLSNWTPRNAAAMRELILSFHDIFTRNVQLSTKSTSMIVSPSKSSSGAFLCHFWGRYVPHSGICLMQE